MACMKWTSLSDQNVSNGGAAVTCLFMVCALKDFKAWGFRNHFAAAKWVYGAVKWHLCAKGWFHSCETPFQMVSWLRNGGFQGVEVSQLRNHFATRGRFSQQVTFGCEISQAMLSPCFWAPLDFDHPKTYVTSKQIRIKALKSKLKHWNQNLNMKLRLKQVKNKTKRYGLASL